MLHGAITAKPYSHHLVHSLVTSPAIWIRSNQLAPIYEELARKLESIPHLVMAKIDDTANEVPGQTVRGYPTLRFFASNNKTHPIDFLGGRNSEEILEFIKEHAT